MLKVNEKRLYKFIFILVCCLFFIPGVVLAEEPEQGEVVIYTDGTYSDHEVIEACEVGKMVKLDIGSFDTAYINNNFEYNANIDGYVYFECGAYNDIKLAYYGINPTRYISYENLLTDAQLETIKTFDFDADELLIANYVNMTSVTLVTDITSFDSSSGRFGYNGYYNILDDGSYSFVSSSGTSYITGEDRYVYYFKYNGEVLYNGLPDWVINYVPFEDIASVYINPIFDSVDTMAHSVDAPQYNVTFSSNKSSVDGQLTCEYYYEGTGLCASYTLDHEQITDTGTITTSGLVITLPQVFINNSNNFLNISNLVSFTFHYDIFITFNADYVGYIDFENIGRFYVNGNSLEFTKTTTWRSSDPPLTYDLVIEDFQLERKTDPIVDGTEESNSVETENEQQNAELDSVISEYNEIEGQFKDNLDTSLNDIDFSFDFGNITDFSTSANFVKSQFDNLTNNPFGSLVGFSLAVGLALLIMGRRL